MHGLDKNQSTNGDLRKSPAGIGRKVALALGVVVAFFALIAFMDFWSWLFRQVVHMLRSLLGL